jgi:hypothetical protein
MIARGKNHLWPAPPQRPHLSRYRKVVMRWSAVLVLALGLGVTGYYPPEPPGVYSGKVEAIGDQLPVFGRFETSSDCTALVPSTECTIDGENTEPAFFEIEFEGLNEQGENCGAAIAIAPDVQLLVHPALNPNVPTAWVFGARVRLAL